MRVALTALGGLGMAVAALVAGLAVRGVPGIALVVLSVVVATFTTGTVIAMVTHVTPGPRFHYRSSQSGRRIRLRGTRSGRIVARGPRNPQRCGQCRSKRELRGHVWVCPRCDLGVSNRTARRDANHDRPEVG